MANVEHIKKAISVRLNLFLYFSSISYHSGLRVPGFQDTRSHSFSCLEFQFHSISWMFGPTEEFICSWTDCPTILSNVQEVLGSWTVWEPGEGIVKREERKKGLKCYAVSTICFHMTLISHLQKEIILHVYRQGNKAAEVTCSGIDLA